MNGSEGGRGQRVTVVLFPLHSTTELHILRAQSQNCEFNFYFPSENTGVQNLENL